MTAGAVMTRMEAKERFSYVYGIVEGLAYARFRKDSLASGNKDEAGMKCIYDWFFPTKESLISDVEAAFRKYPDHIPPVIVAAMVKKECGE